jgi:hypothetical protein
VICFAGKVLISLLCSQRSRQATRSFAFAITEGQHHSSKVHEVCWNPGACSSLSLWVPSCHVHSMFSNLCWAGTE